MKLWTSAASPITSAIRGFLGLCLVALAVGLAGRTGLVDTITVQRAIGLIVGALAVVTGNYLPKLRPLHRRSGPAQSIASERFAGWILVLAGIAWLSLFAFLPLDQAGPLASITGIGAIAAITAQWVAANWAWLRDRVFAHRPTSGEDAVAPAQPLAARARFPRQQKLTIFLLFAFLWIFVTASITYFFRHSPQANTIKGWVTMVFWILYACLTALLGSRRPANGNCQSLRLTREG
jgi:hypothetical protein